MLRQGQLRIGTGSAKRALDSHEATCGTRPSRPGAGHSARRGHSTRGGVIAVQTAVFLGAGGAPPRGESSRAGAGRVDLLEQGNIVLNSQLEATSASLRVSQLQLTEVTHHLATMVVVYEGLCRTYVSNDPMFPAPVASQSNITLPPGVGWQQVADEIIHSGVFTSLSHQSHNQQVAGTSTHPSDSALAMMGVAGRMVSVERQRQADILAGQDYYSILGDTQGSVPMLTQPVPPSPTANISLPAASTDQTVTTTSSRASAPPSMAITMSPSSLGRSSSFPGAPASTNVPGLSDSHHQPCTQQ
ncbi:uncharacterized protein F5147DRAFT_771392 [Suillus discolor]|uniref:Uncharacterized protein n=1 Tax=Suillus discolor TaxID=1912936 RepID=A0A9P7FBF9_9AGAM|nr:uncharacterized protein F5147DRAFT_771392 [Suillus discolor]KAG2112331.1 hypothetical protein F5147DRAFT_771392 [Suillus discolor]